MGIKIDIPELVNANIITQETGDNIINHYSQNKSKSANRLIEVFAVIGAILVGLGIILILAHNWDELSKTIKTFFAFLPLIIGQILCVFALLKKPDSAAWKESASAFTVMAIGASISLISQIYNIPGNLGTFILTWVLLSFPLIYLMKSSITSLLYIAGITYYACEIGYWSRPVTESAAYWVLLAMVLPHYYLLYKHKFKSNFMLFHNWFIPLSLIITLGTVAVKNVAIDSEWILFLTYISLFGLLYIIGNSSIFKSLTVKSNGFLILGSLGTVAVLLGLSFDAIWGEIREENFQIADIVITPEFLISVIISVVASVLLLFQFKNRKSKYINPIEMVFILFTIIFFLGINLPVAALLINLLVFFIGVLTIRKGAIKNNLGILNYGLLIITALVTCRFFDTDLSFITRGLLFVGVGVGFFATNYIMLKKTKANG